MSIVPRSRGLQPSRLRMWLYRRKRIVYRQMSCSIANTGLALLKWRYSHQPIPLKCIRRLRRILNPFEIVHPLQRPGEDNVTVGALLKNPVLASFFSSTKIGDYSLAVETLDFLETYIRQHMPSLIIEFGSGVSTVCLTQYMREIHGEKDPPYVVSFEQDEAYADVCRQMLAENGLAAYAVVVYSPVVPLRVAGVDTSCYDLPDRLLQTVLRNRRPDLVLVDGPSGGGNVRFGTIHLVKDWLAPSASFFMDDALRDWELSIADAWEEIDGIRIFGIYLSGKGLLSGQIQQQRKPAAD